MKTKLIAGIIIVSATILAIASVWNDSPVVDEIPHIGAGYSYVVQHSYQFNPEHPPLAKDLAGLALLPLNLNQSAFSQKYVANWPTDVNGQWNFGRAFIFQTGNDAVTLVRTAKMPMLIFFIISAWIVFVWTKKLFGDKAALLATFLFSFTPTIIAHSRLVTTDMALLAGVMASLYFFERYLENQSTKNLWFAGIVFGFGQLTKFSSFLLIPLVVFLAIVWAYANHQKLSGMIRVAWKAILIVVIGFVFIVGPIYQLHLLNYSGQKQKADATVILRTYGNRTFADPVIWASDKPLLRPFAQYGLGVLMIFQRNVGGNQTYFLGNVYQMAVKSYFPVVYALKEPIPFLILFIIATIGFFTFAFSKERHLKDWLRIHFAETVIFTWVLFYWAISINTNLNIGIRHLIPVYGGTAILVAGQLSVLYEHVKAKKTYLAFVGVMCAWLLAETIMVFPYYLTYFNEFAGGPSGGHRYVVDSNLDWGQDLKRLADWVDANNIKKISLDYFGWADPSYYLGDKAVWIRNGRYTNAGEFVRDNPDGGYIAVSVTFYQQSIATDKNYGWLTEYPPVIVVGNSIFVWHIK
ncbi:MAG: glycosyltransferase family 39 protein [Patescibacteria group bacterium]